MKLLNVPRTELRAVIERQGSGGLTSVNSCAKFLGIECRIVTFTTAMSNPLMAERPGKKRNLGETRGAFFSVVGFVACVFSQRMILDAI
jgi:hypothetical protein